MLSYDLTGCHTLRRLEYVAPSDIAGQAFALVSMGEFDCNDRYYTIRDGLPQGLLLYTVDGCGELEYKGSTVLLPPGSLVVINCTVWQHYRTRQGCRWHFRWMHFCGDNALQLEAAANRDGLFVATLPAAIFNGYWNDILGPAQSARPYSSHAVALHLHRLLAGVVLRKGQQASGGHAPQLPAVGTAAAYMDENFREPLSLEEIAQTAAMSKYHFIKLFAKYMGATPYQYLTVLRITEAKRLLVSTDRPVAAVALSVGFSDSKTFIRSFQKAAGMTPLQYRKNSL